MAASKGLCRLSCRLQALAHNTFAKPSLSPRRVPLISRLPVELSSCESMMPLYSAVASARLVSSLSIESLGWGIVPQGISMPL